MIRLSLSAAKPRSIVRCVITAAKQTAAAAIATDPAAAAAAIETERSHILPTRRTDSKRKKRLKRERPKPAAAPPPRDLIALRAKGERISAILEEFYPKLTLPFEHKDPFQLLVSALLLAQV